jgi:hypothetical protein
MGVSRRLCNGIRVMVGLAKIRRILIRVMGSGTIGMAVIVNRTVFRSRDRWLFWGLEHF